MCGRFALGLRHDEIQAMPGYPNMQVDEWVDQEHFVPRYNIAPHTNAPVVRRRDSANPELMLQTMHWGFQWSKENEKSQNAINARTETILEGVGVWNKMRGKKRCVVVCQGYYEWLKKGKDRLPHFTQHGDGKIMLLAGLYDSVAVEGESGPLCNFAIVTTDASKELSWLHDRQPLILTSQEEIDSWLDTSSQSWNPKLKAMMRPYHDQEAPLKCYQVPKEVGRVGAESATYIQPLSSRKDGIQAMFARQRLKQDPKQIKPSEVPPSRRKRSSSPTLADDGIQIVKKDKRS